MGLAEPRKRIKINHDPRNLAWSTATDSYGQRLMQQQGWKVGDGLGARGNSTRYSDTDAAKVRVQYKDDTLGLGASLKSKDVAHQRTGFDAFQGLLGRLNAKSEDEVKAIEQKMEDKKLAAFAQGRWGGMVFVPGGILVQNDAFKLKVELDKKKQEEAAAQNAQQAGDGDEPDEAAEKAKRKAEKRLRKEQKRLRKEKKLSKRATDTEKSDRSLGLPTPESSSSNETETVGKSHERKSKRSLSPEAKPVTTQKKLNNGRHILRGKNILAKRAAFSDMKGLDEIFMKKP